MVQTALDFEGPVPDAVPVRGAVLRWPLAVGLLAAVGIWVAPPGPLFIVSWVVLFAWLSIRAAVGSRGRGTVRAVVMTALAGALTTGLTLWGEASQPLAALGAVVAAGIMPFHLWIEGLRRRLNAHEFLLLLLCQPGVVWLHRYVEGNPSALHGGLGQLLLVLFVVSALLQSGLGLVRRDPARAISAITMSQACLVMAGAFSGHVGWEAARTFLISMVAGTLVLMSVIRLLREGYGVERLAPDNGLADVAPDFHRLFLAMGWLFVGLPGGLGFFAEDLLFHSLLERSTAATIGFLCATALNAIVFYRVYMGLFSGAPRPESRRAPVPIASRRLRVALLSVVTVLVILGGVAPRLFV